jgi:histidinol-phosphate phosphatase family protein
LTDLSQLELLSESAKGIRQLQEQFRIVVVTNQSMIGRGILCVAQLDEIHDCLVERLRQAGAYLDVIYACPHKPSDACPCRKPEPGLLLQASADLGIDLARSYMIGDKGSDLAAGQHAGVKATILVPSHHTRASLDRSIQPTHRAKNLNEAAAFTLKQASKS